MNAEWESTFRAWSKPLGVVEGEQCEHAEEMIRKAIDASKTLSPRNIRVFAQGSYRNNTNVRQDSDVDICVLCTDTMLFDLADGITREQIGWRPATYDYSTYRRDVEEALTSYFGSAEVKRGNKAFDIHANTYRVDADVVACFEYYYYFRLPNGAITHNTGTAFLPDRGFRVFNYPEQHYQQGVMKNEATGERFKKIARVFKRLRNQLENDGILAKGTAPSFLIESLVWNVPNQYFGHEQYAQDVENVLAYLFGQMSSDEHCKDWTEVNGLKTLFHLTQLTYPPKLVPLTMLGFPCKRLWNCRRNHEEETVQ